MKILNSKDADFSNKLDQLLGQRRITSPDHIGKVAEIIAQVATGGDSALRDLTHRFDGHENSLRVSRDELKDAENALSDELRQALLHAIARIRAYHIHQVPHDKIWKDDQDVFMGWRWHPLMSAGVYVPGGEAGYPSSVIMNVVPAQIAGVPRIVLVTPSPAGKDCSSVLGVASILGIDDVYRVGGAQAIAALGYGTQTIPAVCKIYGPGNAWVTEAKRQLFGIVGIDSIAGPSEVTILADHGQDPNLIAADLLAQAEHGADTQSLLISPSLTLASDVIKSVNQQLKLLQRNHIAKAAIESHGGCLIVSSLEEGLDLVTRIAPEHLQILCASDEHANALAQSARHVGSVFIGQKTPEALGDYIAGPNHVLPTFGSARFASGLGVMDFMRRTSYLQASDSAYSQLHDASIIADAEGLTAHAQSLRMRLPAASPHIDK